MKKTTILISLISLFIYIRPILACDGNGSDDDPYNLPEVTIYPPDDGYDFNWWDYNWPPAGWNDGGSNDGNSGDDDWDDYWNDYNNNNNNNNNNTSDKIRTEQNNLPADAKALLEQTMRKMLEESCAYQAMYGFLDNEGAEFSDVSLSSSVSMGGYNPCSGELLFNSINTIGESFPEEFVHFFQDYYYPTGTCNYSSYNNPYHYNIEFEAKLLQDLLNYVHSGQYGGYVSVWLAQGDTYGNHNTIYDKWMDFLTKGGTSFPSSGEVYQSFQGLSYYDFLNDWASTYMGGVYVAPFTLGNIFSVFAGCN